MRLLHFGGGRIGMGLVIPYFYANNDITLVDRKNDHIKKLLQCGYNLIETDTNNKDIRHITKFNPITYSDLKKAGNIDIITTSVIEHNLPDITPFIAEVIKRNHNRHVYVIPMENSFKSIDIIKANLKDITPLLSNVSFLRSVIDRIVPGFNDSGDVLCEPYSNIKIEKRNSISDLLPAETLSDNIDYEFEKKFFIVNGLHACTAYLGHLNNLSYIHECVANKNIRDKLIQIGDCYSQYLEHKYNTPADYFNEDISSTIDRFGNESIRDPITRVGRNLLIKLSKTGRIVKPLIYNKKHGLTYTPLYEVVDAAKSFKIANDYDDYITSISAHPAK